MSSLARTVVRSLLEDGATADDFDAEELVRMSMPTAFTKQEVVDFFNSKLAPWKFYLAHDNRDLGFGDRDVYLQLDVVAPPETTQSAMRARLRRGAERFASAHELFVTDAFVSLSSEPGRGMLSFNVAPKIHAPPGFRDWWSTAKKRRLWKEQEHKRKYGTPQQESLEDGDLDDEIDWPNRHDSMLPELNAALPGRYGIEYVDWSEYKGSGYVVVSARVVDPSNQGGVLRKKMTPDDVRTIAATIRRHLLNRGFATVRVLPPTNLINSELVPVSFTAYYRRTAES